MIDPCWGMHASVVPSRSDEVIDKQGRYWQRAGVRVWQLDGDGDLFHESWLLREHGPVMCTTVDLMLDERREKLEVLLVIDGSYWRLPDMAAADGSLEYDDAMMLMRAGWLIWPAKQRREALASLAETEARELAVTS